MTRVAVTGAAGLVGRHLCRTAVDRGYEVVALVRAAAGAAQLPHGITQTVVTGDLATTSGLGDALDGVDAVIHLAGRAHVLRDTTNEPEATYRATNVQGSLQVARAAVDAGVRRLVFVSSIKVNGERTTGTAFTELNRPAPEDAYGRSKRDAEVALRELLGDTATELTIVRPPLVYGPGFAGNIQRLLKLIRVGRVLPLPFGAIDNRRSLVYVGNLADALLACAVHPAAAGELFLVSDGEDLSTRDLVARLAAASGERVRMLPVAPPLLTAVARLLGRSRDVDRLLGSLQVDSSRIRQTLGWSPPHTVDQGLRATVGSPPA